MHHREVTQLETKKKRENKPTLEQLKNELKYEKYKRRYNRTLRSTFYALIISAACAVLAATVFLPVLQIYGSSMTPTLNEGEIVVCVKGSDFESGDLVSFYVGNKLLVKRFIAGPGQWVNIDQKGNVYVDGYLIEEPYIEEKAYGDCNIEFPYQVPESRYFFIGDHRKTSIDSRNTAIGCVSEEQIVGKIIFRIWPLPTMGKVS
ncbi:MAG: signal peptidase I [Clostridia bacterium]|nr:signal peptidase I [Clostridia bacterium]